MRIDKAIYLLMLCFPTIFNVNYAIFVVVTGQRSDSTAMLLMCWWARHPESVRQMGVGVANNQPV